MNFIFNKVALVMLGGVLRSSSKWCTLTRSSRKYDSLSTILMTRTISSGTENAESKLLFRDDDSGEFGSLAKKKGVTVFKLPPELQLPMEKDEEERVKPRFFTEKQPRWYFHQCKKLAAQRKWKECLEFFEERMLKQDQVFPEESNYSVVIGALGRAGQSKKAFQLYKAMRERAIVPTASVYTGLFNSVAQSRNRDDLGRAIGLYSKLHRNKIRMNRITYGSLMKVFGRHGTTEQMMGIFRESIVAGFEPDVETFNTILLCLLKHSDTGFREAIQVWRQMILLDIKPNGKSITYLLKLVKECGLGDPNVAYRKLIHELPDPDEYREFFKKNLRNVYWLKGQISHPKHEGLKELPAEPEILNLDAGLNDSYSVEESSDEDSNGGPKASSVSLNKDDLEVENVASVSLTVRNQKTLPNLLELPSFNDAANEHKVLEIKKDLKPFDKLELIGGYSHILDMFEKYDIKPTKMVLSSLVWVLPGKRNAEKEVIEFALKHNVQLDTDFYNSILRKCIYRNDFNWLREILEMMVSAGLEPNYRTWCIMAMSCHTGFHGVSLIKELKEKNVELDVIFFKSMLTAALRNKSTSIEGYDDVKGYDYRYLTRILSEMKDLGIKADEQLVILLEKASDWPEGYKRWNIADTDFERKVFNFRRRYKEWLGVTEMIEVT